MNPNPWGQPPSPPVAPPPKKSSPLMLAGIIGGSGLAFVALIAFVSFMAKRQAHACDDAIARARVAVAKPVDGGDDAPTTIAAKDVIERCARIPERAADVETMKAILARRAVVTKTVRAWPAMKAAGYQKEQVTRDLMAPVCQARGLYPVEMIGTNVPGEPHYWDCEPNAVFGTMYLDSRDCEARKLEHTTIIDESGKTVGVCAKAATSVEEDKLRAACKVGASANLRPADKGDVIGLCRVAVERLLKAPRSAEHPGILDHDGTPTSPDGCVTVYPSYVDAQNVFGAKLRTRYVCTYDPRTGIATPTMMH